MRFLVLLAVVTAMTFVTPTTASAQAPGFFRADGVEIVDSTGSPVLLKGLGLGGWLVPEGYMLHIAAPDGGSPTTIRNQIEDLIGIADTDTFYESYEENYVAERDIAAIAEWGFDHIRLPFHYKQLFDPATETFIEDGFTLFDTFIEWCRTYNLNVILDMHAAPGAQNSGNISDSDGTARLWTEPDPYQDQTVAIWKEIATRYADEKLIIGYDLINEPVTPDGVTGFDLRDLYVRIADSVRTVDQNHILFIEGNFYATHFPELLPPFDDNMVYSFHKYWNGTGLNSIQYLLDIRTTHNTPLWLGETGENSNVWFHQVFQMMEEHNIGWNFWTHKKIESTTSPRSAPFAPGYERVLDYWRGNAAKPPVDSARAALFDMAAGLHLDSTSVEPTLLQALLDPDFSTTRTPLKDHIIPGTINAVDYDIGNQGTTYSDSEVMATSGTPGGGNNGGQYRNDGVDIERSTDPQGFAYNLGWTAALEWTTYTVQVETSGQYDIELRVASDVGGGRFQLLVDDVRIGTELTVANTGGWQNWSSVWMRDVELTEGEHILKMLVRTAGFNLNQMRFVLVSAINVEDDHNADVGSDFRLLDVYPNPSADEIQVVFQTPASASVRVALFDTLGRRVHAEPARALSAGEHNLAIRPGLSAGAYQLVVMADEGKGVRKISTTIVVGR